MTEARAMTKAQAAEYLAITTRTFDRWRAAGKLPEPIPGTRRYDHKAIDLMLDKLGNFNPNHNPRSAYEEWKNARSHKDGAKRLED